MSEVTIEDMDGRRRRVDIVVDEGSDWVSVVEIKRTDWDRMMPHRIRPNALRHARQIWRYILAYLEGRGREVCPGVIYENVPATPGRVDEIETIMNEEGIQVVWETESMDELTARKRAETEDGDA